MPSAKCSFASTSNEPGTLPPTSAQCPFDWAIGDDLALVEDRPDDADVVEVRAADVRVVDREDVPGWMSPSNASITALQVKCSVPT